jgi:callose synthase
VSALLAYVTIVLCIPGWIASIPRRIRRKIAPAWVTFSGGEMSTSVRATFYSWLFWLILIPSKCLLSYYMEVVPALKLTATIWRIQHYDAHVDFSVQHSQDYHPPLQRFYFLLLCVWIPTWLLFLLDAQVLYTLLQSITAVLVGIQRRTGGASFMVTSVTRFTAQGFHVNGVIHDDDTDNRRARMKISANFENRLSACCQHSATSGQSDVTATRLTRTKSMSVETLLSPMLSSDRTTMQWTTGDGDLFRMVWNEMVHQFREADLCNFEEEFILKIPLAWNSIGLAGHGTNIPLFAVIGAFEYGTWKLSKTESVVKWWANLSERKNTQLAFNLVWTIALKIIHRLLNAEDDVDTVCHNFQTDVINHTGALQEDDNSVSGNKLQELGEKCGDLVDAFCGLNPSEFGPRLRGSNRMTAAAAESFSSELRKLQLVTSNRPSNAPTVLKAVNELLEFLRDKMGLGETLHNSIQWSGEVVTDTVIDSYAVETFVQKPKQLNLVAMLHHLLRTPLRDALPRNEEVRRRLQYFTSSLNMQMPDAVSVRRSVDFSTLVPMYGEEVLYTRRAMESEAYSDGILSLLDFIKVCHPEEHENLLTRVKEHADSGTTEDESDGFVWSLDPRENESETHAQRLWLSERNQTLSRTIRGMHHYERALRALAEHELPGTGSDLARELARQKHCFVVSCQIFGKWAKAYSQARQNPNEKIQEDAHKFEAICWLMHRYTHVRVAFIDDRNDGCWSVLVKHGNTRGKDGIDLAYVEIYRIQLPGNPITTGIGEGKPENQNHAIIFTRGSVLQTVSPL